MSSRGRSWRAPYTHSGQSHRPVSKNSMITLLYSGYWSERWSGLIELFVLQNIVQRHERGTEPSCYPITSTLCLSANWRSHPMASLSNDEYFKSSWECIEGTGICSKKAKNVRTDRVRFARFVHPRQRWIALEEYIFAFTFNLVGWQFNRHGKWRWLVNVKQQQTIPFSLSEFQLRLKIVLICWTIPSNVHFGTDDEFYLHEIFSNAIQNAVMPLVEIMTQKNVNIGPVTRPQWRHLPH